MLIGIPSILGLVLLSEPIILTLFERGEFLATDTTQASYSLIALALGLIAFMLIKVLTPSFFARQDPKTPLKVALASMIVNAFLAWLLAFHLGLNHVGLAMASSIAAYFSISILLFILLKNKFYEVQKGWIVFLGRILMACLLMTLIVHFMNIETFAWRELEQAERFLRLLFVIISSIAGYLAMLWILGIRLAHLKG
jgi:putative peptidoglycan lipid II flippase